MGLSRRGRLFTALLAAIFVVALAVTAALGSNGPIATLAGSGTAGFSGDGGPATSARLDEARGVSPISGGGVLVADTKNHRVRRIAGDGTITTVAGNGTSGFGGDGGPAGLAQLRDPTAAVPVSNTSFLIADEENHRIRRVDSGSITTVAGTGSGADGGENMPAVASALQKPSDVWPVDAGAFLIADTDNHKVRLVEPGGNVRTIAGTGSGAFSGDGGPAQAAELDQPRGVAADTEGNVYIADAGNNRIRRIGTDGVITTVAGHGSSGFSGDGGQATLAALTGPTDVVPVSGGGFLVADFANERVRHVGPDGVISTLAGTGAAAFNGDGGPPEAAELDEPHGVALDAAGTVYVADAKNYRVRTFATQLGLSPGGGGGSGGAGGGSGGAGGGGGGAGGGEAEDDPDEEPPTDPDPDLADPAPPIVGKRVVASPVRGRVLVRTPTGSAFVPLDEASSIPVGSLVDTRAGAVRLTTAANGRGKVQRAVFYDGMFQIRQRRTARPVTELALRGAGPQCGAGISRRAHASRARRGLWGRGRGRFRTRGRNGAATVRGTIWFTGDRCDGTIVRVRRGVVAVEDFARERRVLVRAGSSYLARSRAARPNSRR